MSITKISRNLLDTGISDSSDATAVTITSDEDFLVRQTSSDVFDTNSGSTVRQFWGNQFSASNNTSSKVMIGSASNKGLVGGATVNASSKAIVNSYMAFESIDQTAGGEDGVIGFYTSSGGAVGAEQMRLTNLGNLHLSGGSDRRIQLGSGGAGSNQVSNNTVHIRGDGTDMKFMAASGGFYQYEINGSEAMRIDTSGTLIVDRTDKPNAGEKVAVSRNGIAIAAGTDSGEYRLMYGNDSSNMILYFSNGSNQAQLSAAGAWVDASDVAYKKDIVDINYGLDTIKKLKPRTYKMKPDDEQQIGFVAQELELDIPEIVNGEDGSKGVAYGQLTAVLTKAIQEQQTIIEDLKARIETLEG